MKKGIERFELHLQKLEALFIAASAQKNPALWLYTNNARTPLFMLEGLAKLYAGLHNRKMFEKLKERFKALEDTLGQVDYYDAFAKAFEKDSTIPVSITAYLHAQAREKLQSFNELLVEEGWTGEKADRFQKIRKKLAKADWLKEKKELDGIAGYYKASFTEIRVFFGTTKGKFTQVETQVHSLRRKLRWLSIFPQALHGPVQLIETAVKDEALQQYLTPEIVNSPFNKMPDAGDCSCLLLLEKENFFALSWMIDKLGKLKDEGLKLIAIAEALQQMKNIAQPEALRAAIELTGSKEDVLNTILTEAYSLCAEYLKDKRMEKILVEVKELNA